MDNVEQLAEALHYTACVHGSRGRETEETVRVKWPWSKNDKFKQDGMRALARTAIAELEKAGAP